ncbi:sugar phosphate nucleotidyltransferase [Aestuariimicrobium sp. p3-SID1156]|uniref:sugar phosphate nucleotidyltransferase n=1 Tax=Aestuariimicrobium sp. p3-SID1156 TaxID=2916038 RepID=UPI00223C0297|nr:sugar phosphate nucleotidyltransferase [Aestuariimicrobium sp. p3-SID1156]MCT1458744.1 sugar phosphate nucleotidyltransferase [Aestuariimicrobium sp. p3-SID1156]
MTYSAPHRAVIMARGLGTRMRKEAEGLHLDADQQAAAEAGVKAMISVGRPFLDHVLGELADAGYDEVCLVIGPEHQIIRDYYDGLDTTRVTISYAIQDEPLGTANAVYAAHEFAGEDRVLVINSDNHYPAEAVAQLAQAPGAATLGFDRYAMVEGSNIAADRIAAFALLQSDPEGNLREIIEKPSPEMAAFLGEDALLSMNCWLLTPAIVEACGTVGLSARGEYELVDAVRDAVAAGEPVTVVPVKAPVLDLSNRNDISGVAERLQGKDVVL